MPTKLKKNEVPIRFMNPLQNCFQNLINAFYIPIGMWVIGILAIMLKVQLGAKFRHHVVSGMFSMVCNDSPQHTKSGKDMIENKKAFSILKEHEAGIQVELGDDATYSIKGMGFISF